MTGVLREIIQLGDALLHDLELRIHALQPLVPLNDQSVFLRVAELVEIGQF